MTKYGLMADCWDTDRVTYGTKEDFPTRESFAAAIGAEVQLHQISIFYGYWCQDDECEEVPEDEQLDKHFHLCKGTDDCLRLADQHWQGWVYKGAV